MWFKKTMLIVRFRQVLEVIRNASPHKPNRRVCEKLLRQLDTVPFNYYHPAYGLAVSVQTRYPNIETYTQRLIEITRILKQELIVGMEWGQGDDIEISVDRFMTSSDNYYINIPNAISAFKEAGLQLCQVMEKSDTETYGIFEHNLRMTTKLFINLQQVTTKLIEVSLTNQ